MPEQPTPAEQAFQQLVDAAGTSRRRRADDATDPLVPVAATVILARDGRDGPEVLLIERPDRGSFAGAWVFPGGKLDPADVTSGAGEEDDASRAAARETAEEVGLAVDPAALVPLSCWDPPPGLALRIRTWFFLVRAPEGMLTLSPGEAMAAQWSRPADVLDAHGRGELTLYPPTWVTLHGLTEHVDVDDLLGAVRLSGMRRFETVARPGPKGPMLLWQEDADYVAETPAEASAARHRLEIGELPWRYERGS